ncbi:MAG TPA: cytochrome c biogenesis protein CcsA [Tepidisphaeraceae bacterium]|jgi:ABC-type uncharacterized transport system permease subunit|nr:cytochrome c biogenesis protein CcsA [Tepidisphaeraceae bacterium]
MTPTLAQLLILFLAAACFAGGVASSTCRVWTGKNHFRLLAKIQYYLGLLLGLLVLVWHAVNRHDWVPLGDNFDTLVWLGMLLALFVLYVQRAKPLVGLDWFVMPVVMLLFICAGIFGKAKPQDYVTSSLLWMHSVTAYLGFVAFAIAGAAGLMYLIANRRLRSKSPAGPRFGSLERLEHITFLSVTIGFALLTIGLITGIARIHHGGNGNLGPHWFTSPKVLLASAVWVVYALVLHAPFNPSFRGRRTAMLSILGFVLMVGTLVVVQFMPAGGSH